MPNFNVYISPVLKMYISLHLIKYKAKFLANQVYRKGFHRFLTQEIN